MRAIETAIEAEVKTRMATAEYSLKEYRKTVDKEKNEVAEKFTSMKDMITKLKDAKRQKQEEVDALVKMNKDLRNQLKKLKEGPVDEPGNSGS